MGIILQPNFSTVTVENLLVLKEPSLKQFLMSNRVTLQKRRVLQLNKTSEGGKQFIYAKVAGMHGSTLHMSVGPKDLLKVEKTR